MLRIIAFIVAAFVLLAVLWWLVHLLVLGFWIVLLGLLGIGLFRVTRWSRTRD
jgi:hypothetical protein